MFLGGVLLAQVDIYWGRLTFQVAPPDRFLRAEGEWHFKGHLGALMEWDLGPGLEITSLTASVPVDTFWRDTLQRKVYVQFVQPLQGAEAWIRVAYQGEPRTSGFGSYEVRPHATGWCVWTLSQPYGAPDWLFCRDGLGDKVDSLDIAVITPDTLMGVANGRLVADSVSAGGWRYRHFRHRYPIAVYLIAFAASTYAVQEVPVQTPYHTFTLRNYVYPQDTGRARQLTAQFLPYFSWIEERLGPYPFASEDYQQVQIGWGGGMEHQTITFFGSYSLELWAHELAHQWFGDWVTCSSWQDIWLNEGFATYLGGAVYEALVPSLWPIWRRLTIRAAWRDTGRTIWVEDTTRVERIFAYSTTYAKGAAALHGLREYVGETSFWAALRQYLSVHRGGFASTADFAQTVFPFWGESVTRAFIEGWIYAPGYPKVRLEWPHPLRLRYRPERLYPLRVPGRVQLVGGDTVTWHMDLLQDEGSFSFTEPLRLWEADPDTITPYWGPRRAVPTSEGLIGPNPTGDKLFVGLAGLRRIEVYDPLGRKVAELSPSPIEAPFLWELPPLAKGLYLLRIETAEKTHQLRLAWIP